MSRTKTLRFGLMLGGTLGWLGCGNSEAERAGGSAGTASDGSAGSGGTRATGGTSGSLGAGGSSGTAASAGTSGNAGTSSGGASGTSSSDGAAGSGGVSAVPVSTFLGSIGVCTHIGQGVDDASRSATALSYAGIRNLRDDGNSGHIADWIGIHQTAGVRTLLLTDRNIASTVDMAKQLNAAGALLAVEGPNEPNNWPVTYENQTSGFNTTFLPVAHFQRDLFAAVKADPALSGVPVFHSSEAGGAEPDDVGLQFLKIPAGAAIAMPDGTEYADYANTHNYVCGHQNALVDNVCWNAVDPTLNADWDGLYVEYGHTWHGGFQGYSDTELGTLPRVSTETGWVTSGTGSITQEQQGRLFLNLYLSAFARGWSYTFIYMLRDDPVQGYWGLFDVNYDPKLSGTYLHNFTTILADTGAATPGRLAYWIPNEPTTVHDLLMQKSSGAFELAVWNERPTGGSDDVSVVFDSVRAIVAIYDPTTGTSPTKALSNVNSVPLTLTDHPLIIEL